MPCLVLFRLEPLPAPFGYRCEGLFQLPLRDAALAKVLKAEHINHSGTKTTKLKRSKFLRHSFLVELPPVCGQHLQVLGLLLGRVPLPVPGQKYCGVRENKDLLPAQSQGLCASSRSIQKLW